MKLFFDYTQIPAQNGTVITLGNFDGFHLGHQRIVGNTVHTAREKGLSSLVITFQPHPRQLLAGDLAVLTPFEQKVKLIAESGTDQILVQPFTKSFAATNPSQFLKQVLFDSLRCRHIVVGYNYSFGKAGAGNTKLMQSVASQLGIGCDIIPPVTWEKEVISSTAVRQYLSKGDVETAGKYMGRLFAVSGKVEMGAGRGKTLGFPTANIYPAPSAALPALGVYIVKIRVQGHEHWGLANIGYHPTFPDNKLSLEVFILEYSGSLYGSMADVMFHSRLRPEVRFPDRDSLVRQLEQDVSRAKTLLNMDDMLKLQRI